MSRIMGKNLQIWHKIMQNQKEAVQSQTKI